MDGEIKIPRRNVFKLAHELFQAGEDGPRLDLTGRTVSIADSNLPFEPTITVTDAVNGEVLLQHNDTDSVRVHYEYRYRIVASAIGLEPVATPIISLTFV